MSDAHCNGAAQRVPEIRQVHIGLHDGVVRAHLLHGTGPFDHVELKDAGNCLLVTADGTVLSLTLASETIMVATLHGQLQSMVQEAVERGADVPQQ